MNGVTLHKGLYPQTAEAADRNLRRCRRVRVNVLKLKLAQQERYLRTGLSLALSFVYTIDFLFQFTHGVPPPSVTGLQEEEIQQQGYLAHKNTPSPLGTP